MQILSAFPLRVFRSLSHYLDKHFTHTEDTRKIKEVTYHLSEGMQHSVRDQILAEPVV